MSKGRRYDIAVAQAVAIVLIVQSHIKGSGYWGSARVLMPLQCAMVVVFVFTAGYFNAAKSVGDPLGFAKTRVRKLLIPLYGATLLYAAIVVVLHALGVPRGTVNLYNVLLDPLLSGHGLSYNLPMWFIAPLFFAEVAYAFLGRIFNRGGRILDLCLIAASLLVAHCWGRDGVEPGVLCLTLRTVHFLGWYALGRVYRERLESVFARLPIRCGMLAYVAVFLAVDAATKGNCSVTISWLKFGADVLSVVVMLDGLFGLLLLGRMLEPIARRSRTIALLSQNTFAIMSHHLLGIFLAMSVLALASRLTPWFNSFDMRLYLTSFNYAWFPRGLAEFAWAYVVFGIAFAVWFQRMIDKVVAAARDLLSRLSRWPARGCLLGRRKR